MKIKFILGEAGCAKTSTLARIQSVSRMSSVALAFTHSACNNMKDKGMINVHTLHSFFKIMPNTSFITIPKHIPELILIDEFSMIPLPIIESIFKNLAEFDTTITLAGDLLQLPPIKEEPYITLSNIDDIDITDLTFNDVKLILNMLGKTIYTFKEYHDSDKLILTKNYRNGSHVKQILDDIFNTGIIHLSSETPADCVFIASTYRNLKKMWKKWYGRPGDIQTRIGKIASGKVIITENIETPTHTFNNGDIVEIIAHEPDNILGDVIKTSDNAYIKTNEQGLFDVLPINFLTVHYSQGRGFDNVCLCIDDLFELGMLYTGITRARNNISFISFKNQDTIDCSDITRPFNRLKETIYKK